CINPVGKSQMIPKLERFIARHRFSLIFGLTSNIVILSKLVGKVARSDRFFLLLTQGRLTFINQTEVIATSI
ncbi:MAG: hypothetical protein ACYT04_90645, partial [Nostoc sp.]